MNKKRRADLIRLLAVAIVIFAVIYFYFNAFVPRLIPRPMRIGIIQQPVTLLILGTDLNFDAVSNKEIFNVNTRTDTIMLVRFDPIADKIKIISIPRDTYVNIPGYGYSKINAAHVYGGVPLTRQTISELLGRQKIDYYLEIQPEIVIELVNLLGGLKINVEKEMRYVDHAQHLNINLKPGLQKLSGQQAQDYIRFRHDAAGDLGRIERQQKFFAALTQALLSPPNLVKSPMILMATLKNVKTDLPAGLLFRLANYCRFISLDNIVHQTVPGTPTTVPGAGSIILPDKYQLQEMLKTIF
jgi:LCP family protein required for cell wall assembly